MNQINKSTYPAAAAALVYWLLKALESHGIVIPEDVVGTVIIPVAVGLIAWAVPNGQNALVYFARVIGKTFRLIEEEIDERIEN